MACGPWEESKDKNLAFPRGRPCCEEGHLSPVRTASVSLSGGGNLLPLLVNLPAAGSVCGAWLRPQPPSATVSFVSAINTFTSTASLASLALTRYFIVCTQLRHRSWCDHLFVFVRFNLDEKKCMMVCVWTGLCEARPCIVGAVKGNLGSSGHKSEWMKGKETLLLHRHH